MNYRILLQLARTRVRYEDSFLIRDPFMRDHMASAMNQFAGLESAGAFIKQAELLDEALKCLKHIDAVSPYPVGRNVMAAIEKLTVEQP